MVRSLLMAAVVSGIFVGLLEATAPDEQLAAAGGVGPVEPGAPEPPAGVGPTVTVRKNVEQFGGLWLVVRPTGELVS